MGLGKKTIDDQNYCGKKVLVRCDFNVPMKDGVITNENRISHIKGGKGKGFFYWEPAWIPVPGSGWATPASLKYMNDPGPCGNEWANQALFDYDGNALPTLSLIRDFKPEV